MPIPDQRWQPYAERPDAVSLANQLALSPLLGQILWNRGLQTLEAIQAFLQPESVSLPSPLLEFPALATSVDLLQQAIAASRPIAICGDYDADGMTSTALLLRALRLLGADVQYAIPSRMAEGYGLNRRMVTELHQAGVGLILTVDNGISAHEPVAYARELGLGVIITDHHDLPDQLPVANAILNPKLIPETSAYRGLAGVGVAYVLARSLAEQMGRAAVAYPLLDLFTVGTIADMVPLVGVNRCWLRQGLKRLPESSIPGIQALITASGVKTDGSKRLKPDDIGFRLGPRINAIGRIGDPEVIIELLTTDDPAIARERAEDCEAANQQRQALCQRIEAEAIDQCDRFPFDPERTRVLLLLKADWHHGVIGIVASRLVERYGLPVFIATYEAAKDGEPAQIRGSARGIPEFNVFEALDFCQETLGKYGGHPAAGGFSLPLDQFEAFQQRLQQYALQTLQPHQLKPLLKLDAEAQFSDLTPELYDQIDALHPWGMGNPEPIFWSRNIQVAEQRIVGNGHLKAKLTCPDSQQSFGAIAWRWDAYYPLPKRLDIAYKLRQNTWNNQTNLELELIGARLATPPGLPGDSPRFQYSDRHYICQLDTSQTPNHLHIYNNQGDWLMVRRGSAIAELTTQAGQQRPVDVRERFFNGLVKAAVEAMNKPVITAQPTLTLNPSPREGEGL